LARPSPWGLSPPILCQLSWRTPQRVKNGSSSRRVSWPLHLQLRKEPAAPVRTAKVRTDPDGPSFSARLHGKQGLASRGLCRFRLRISAIRRGFCATTIYYDAVRRVAGARRGSAAYPPIAAVPGRRRQRQSVGPFADLATSSRRRLTGVASSESCSRDVSEFRKFERQRLCPPGATNILFARGICARYSTNLRGASR
jgi:hypothetical protein